MARSDGESENKMRQSIIEICREFRKNSTPAEKVFWQAIRNRKVLNKKFNRQFPIIFSNGFERRFFIADFYCHENRLIVEIDGGIHETQTNYDKFRTEILNQHEYKVIRFSNEQVLKKLGWVIDELKVVLDSPAPFSGDRGPHKVSG